MDSTHREIIDIPVTVRRPVWRNVRCARCSTPLQPARTGGTTGDGGWLELAGARALTLQVWPSYGTYVDSLHDTEQLGEDLLVLCEACVTGLRVEIPGLDRVLAGIEQE